MVNFATGKLTLDYPIYGSKFLNDSTLLVVGGGGEGNNGIPNKITACTVDFNRTKIVKRFRELTLRDDEDAPTCLDANNNVILFSCNEGTASIKSGQNKHLRKYGYINNHLRFLQDAQINESTDNLEYTKSVSLSEDGSVACLSSSQSGEIFIVDTDTLEVKFNIDTKSVVKDLCISSDGKILAYVTASSSVEFISTVTGSQIASQAYPDLNFSKIKFANDNNSVIMAASAKKTQVLVLIEYSIGKKTTTRQKIISKKTRGVTCMAYSNGLIALGGNDTSVLLVKASNFSLIKQFPKVHTFAVTTVQISPNGQLLASTSADNSINIFKLPPNLANSTSFLVSLFTKLLTFILVIILGVIIQWMIKNKVITDLIDYYKKEMDSSSYFTIQPVDQASSVSPSPLDPVAWEVSTTDAEDFTYSYSSSISSSSIPQKTTTTTVESISSEYPAAEVESSVSTSFSGATKTSTYDKESTESILSSPSPSSSSSKPLSRLSTSASSSTESTDIDVKVHEAANSSSATDPLEVVSTEIPTERDLQNKSAFTSLLATEDTIESTKSISSLSTKVSTEIVDSLLLTESPSTEKITPEPSDPSSHSTLTDLTSLTEMKTSETSTSEESISSAVVRTASDTSSEAAPSIAGGSIVTVTDENVEIENAKDDDEPSPLVESRFASFSGEDEVSVTSEAVTELENENGNASTVATTAAIVTEEVPPVSSQSAVDEDITKEELNSKNQDILQEIVEEKVEEPAVDEITEVHDDAISKKEDEDPVSILEHVEETAQVADDIVLETQVTETVTESVTETMETGVESVVETDEVSQTATDAEETGEPAIETETIVETATEIESAGDEASSTIEEISASAEPEHGQEQFKSDIDKSDEAEEDNANVIEETENDEISVERNVKDEL